MDYRERGFIEYDLPEHWAVYLMYQKDDTLTVQEQFAIDCWISEHPEIGIGDPINISEDPFFRWKHDADRWQPGGAMCLTYTFVEKSNE